MVMLGPHPARQARGGVSVPCYSSTQHAFIAPVACQALSLAPEAQTGRHVLALKAALSVGGQVAQHWEAELWMDSWGHQSREKLPKPAKGPRSTMA